MNTTAQPSTKPKTSKFTFISNPFTSSFEGMSKLFKHNQTPAIVILILSFFGAIFNLFSSFPSSSNNSSTTTSGSVDNEIIAPFVAFAVVIFLIFMVISIIVSVLYTGVVNYVTWKTSRGESTDLGEALRETMKRFWRILELQIIVGLKIFLGIIFFIVPGIRAALRYQMVFIAMFDEDLGVQKSMDRIKALTHKNLMEVFGIMTVSQLLFPVAILIQMGGESVLYPQLKQLKDNNLPKPETHWLNYLGFIIFGAFFFLFAMTMLLVLSFMSSINP